MPDTRESGQATAVLTETGGPQYLRGLQWGGRGGGKGDGSVWDSGPRSAVNKPCDLGRPGSPSGE